MRLRWEVDLPLRLGRGRVNDAYDNPVVSGIDRQGGRSMIRRQAAILLHISRVLTPRAVSVGIIPSPDFVLCHYVGYPRSASCFCCYVHDSATVVTGKRKRFA